MTEPVVPITYLLQAISSGVNELKTDVRKVREALDAKASAEDVRELQHQVAELQKAYAADEAAAKAIHSVRTSRRAIWLAILLPLLSTIAGILYNVFAK